ncbi:MAG: hypothetical protein L0271_00505, partial [Gemmatimonadetes bacterium]|nr:hypothetical protein [Gemmatimonadota bacterium]
MNLAVISLCALIVAIVVSFTTKVNVGVLSIALAWVIGVYLGGMPLSTITAGFPVQLFLMLAGVTMLFTQAQLNGTLDRIAHRAVKSCRGNVGLIPIMFFLLASSLASIGPGSIAMAALIGPMAMRVAGRAGISAPHPPRSWCATWRTRMAGTASRRSGCCSSARTALPS